MLSEQDKTTLLLCLADSLSDMRVEMPTITQALHTLCQRLPFACGLVYARNESDGFTLMESCQPQPETISTELSADVFSVQDQHTLAQQGLLYLTKARITTAPEQRFWDLCQAESLLWAPVTDNQDALYGFVLLLDFSQNSTAIEEELPFLQTLLALFTHALGGYLYRKRIDGSRFTLEHILDYAGIDIYVNDFYTHEILYVNHSMAAPYGGRQAFNGRKCWQVLFPGQDGPCEFCPQHMLLNDDGTLKQVYSWDYQRAFDGAWFRVFSVAFYWTDGRLAHLVSSADITENKRNEAIIENLANYDQLTQLPNRRKLLLECARRIQKATENELGYILFFDIDGFKAINDTLGHDAGDAFLIQLGQFFSSIPLLKDAIYRNGGDEFVAILGGESLTKDHIISLAHFIHERFKKPWKLQQGDVFCSTSIGIACYPEDGLTPDVLIQKADQAMYQVKKSGGGELCFACEVRS